MNERELVELLQKNEVEAKIIDDVIASGYFLRSYHDFSGSTFDTISDKFYGNKGISSNFEPAKFIRYLKYKEDSYKPVNINRHIVSTYEDIQEILAEHPAKKFIESGQMCFRGQSRDHFIRRKIPNPIRKNDRGEELTIMPGIFRGRSLGESRYNEFFGKSSIQPFLHLLEPNNPNIHQIPLLAYDIMRVEQHYATHTAGLDITFDIRFAIFFATHQYCFEDGRATYKKIKRGQHQGSIYLFRFLDPSVKKTQFYIQDFDLFKTHRPERVLRQHCGLPLFSEYERNIAVTDLHCIIDLHEDFEYEGFSYSYMFPNEKEDSFYRELMKLKANFPSKLKDIVEYYEVQNA